MLPVGFEPKIPAGERPQAQALDRAATGTGVEVPNFNNFEWEKSETYYWSWTGRRHDKALNINTA
jgi:hypothetical protein